MFLPHSCRPRSVPVRVLVLLGGSLLCSFFLLFFFTLVRLVLRGALSVFLVRQILRVSRSLFVGFSFAPFFVGLQTYTEEPEAPTW